MNKIARKLVLSVLTVVLTVAALGTTTFAWFTLTNTSVVQPFQAQIVSDTGIEIAVGQPTVSPLDLNWVTTLTTAEITAYIQTAYLNAFKFNMVTTVDAVNFNSLGIGALVPVVPVAGKLPGVLEIPLNFRSNTANRILWDSVSLSSPNTAWLSDVAFRHVDNELKTASTSILIDASNAMRVAIIGNLTSGVNVVTYEKPASAGVNIVLGTGGDFSGPLVLVGTNLVPSGTPGSLNYYFSKNAELPFGYATVTTVSTLTSLSNNPILDMPVGSGVDAGQAYYGQVMIRIWLEGWDANAFNSVLTRIIQAQFQFSGTTV